MGKKPAEKAAAAEKEKKAAQKETKKEAQATARETSAEKKAKKKEQPHHHFHATSKPRSEMHCKVKSCKRRYRAKGYCTAHYRMWRQGKYGIARYKTCHDKGGCLKPMAKNRHGFCEEHYQNYYVKGMEAPKVAAAKPEAEKPADKAAAG